MKNDLPGVLDNTNLTADQRLMEDIANAPDPYDGGCPADVHTSYQAKREELHSPLESSLNRMFDCGFKAGVNAALGYMRQMIAIRNEADFDELTKRLQRRHEANGGT